MADAEQILGVQPLEMRFEGFPEAL